MSGRMKNGDQFRFYHGRSMRTTFQKGDCIIFKPLDLEQLKEGDIIVFSADSPGNPEIVHRIISITGDTVVTRGDDNHPDHTETVQPNNILGKVTAIERNGRRLPVQNGKPNRLRSRLPSERSITGYLLRKAYRLLKLSRIATLFWHPKIQRLNLETDPDFIIRLISKGKTIGKWRTDKNILFVRKPWDLVVRIKDGKLKT